MPCTEPAQASTAAARRRAPLQRAGSGAVLAAAGGLGACIRRPPQTPGPAQTTSACGPAPTLPAGGAPAAPAAPSTSTVALRLAAPAPVRTQAELKRRSAQRLVQAHPDSTCLRRAPDRLHASSLLEVEFHADGSVRRIAVLRHPSTGKCATQLAIAAVRCAAPYGEISRVPKPWKVVEAFLSNDELRFKPRTLDLE